MIRKIGQCVPSSISLEKIIKNGIITFPRDERGVIWMECRDWPSGKVKYRFTLGERDEMREFDECGFYDNGPGVEPWEGDEGYGEMDFG